MAQIGQLIVAVSRTINGKGFQSQRTITGDIVIETQKTVAAAKTGSLTTRTSGTAGTLTMDPGHGITTGQRLDIYWNNGANVAYGCLVGTVATNSVPFTGGQGDALPSAATAITAIVPTEVDIAITGDNVQGYGWSSDQPGTFVFADGSATTLLEIRAKNTSDSGGWDNADGSANPLAGVTVAKLFLSQYNSAAASVMVMGVLTN